MSRDCFFLVEDEEIGKSKICDCMQTVWPYNKFGHAVFCKTKWK